MTVVQIIFKRTVSIEYSNTGNAIDEISFSETEELSLFPIFAKIPLAAR